MVEIEKPRITCFDSQEDPSYGKYVVDILEGDVLLLHLVPDGVG